VIVELADWTPDVRILGNVGIRTILIEGNQVLPGHEHNFPHATHVDVSGPEGIEVTFIYRDGRQRVVAYRQGDWFEVPADVGHQLKNKSKTPAVCLCVSGARNKAGEIVELLTDEIRRDHFWHERRGGGDTN